MVIDNFLVSGVTPTNKEVNVETTTSITVQFSKDMMASSIGGHSLILRSICTASAIQTTISYNQRKKQAVITPSSPLEGSTRYQLTVVGGKNGIVSILDNGLSEDKQYEFTTKSGKTISEPLDLDVETKDGYVSGFWTSPSIVNDYAFEVAIGKSKQTPDESPGDIIFPMKGDISVVPTTVIHIPKKLSEGNYYFYLRSKTEKEKSDWISKAFYIEEESSNEGNGSTDEDSNVVVGSQFVVTSSLPEKNERLFNGDSMFIMLSQSVVVETVSTSSVYVVEQKAREKYNKLDWLTVLSSQKQIKGISVEVVPQEAEDTESIIEMKISVDDKGNSILKKDTDYSIVMTDKIISEKTGKPLKKEVIGFHTIPQHMYADINAIYDYLVIVFPDITFDLIYAFYGRVSERAYRIYSQTKDFNQKDFEDGNIPSILTDYVNYQIIYDVLATLFMKMSVGEKESIKLGDLTVTTEASKSSVSSLLRDLKDKLKDLEDALHGHNNRGYAKPSAVVPREAGGYPEPMTRSEIKGFGN